MEFLSALWLPILLSAVFVFVVSSVLHMAFRYHKAEYQEIPGEDNVLQAMRAGGFSPGEYIFPHAEGHREMNEPEMIAKFESGPVGFMTIMPSGRWKMAPSLVQWFLFSLLVSVFVAYVTNLAVGPGADYRRVFRVAGAVAVLAYAVTHVPDSIWKGKPWRNTLMHVVDGVVYGLVTAGVFGWLWPE